jgi:hypothetical protein
MDIGQLTAELTRRQALIVHFSHFSNMREGGVFPDDLQAAIAHKDCWALSCCAVWPGHSMQIPGEVGLIFRPTAVDQILSVANSDAGAQQFGSGDELSGGNALTPQSLADSFHVKAGDYNEWRVRGAEVCGIFVAHSAGVNAKTIHKIDDGGIFGDDTIAPSPFSIAEVRAAFTALPLVSMTANGPMIIS